VSAIRPSLSVSQSPNEPLSNPPRVSEGRTLFLGTPWTTHVKATKYGVSLGGDFVPPYRLPFDRILVSHNRGSISYRAIETLGEWKIPLTIIGRGGQPIASVLPFERQEGPTQIGQMRAHLNPRMRLVVARAFVEGKTGVRVRADSPTRLRSQEGQLERAFWPEFRARLPARFAKSFNGRFSQFGKGRLNVKATDPANSAINYACGILAGRCRVLIQRTGLSPLVPFLHEPATQKESFVFDVQELGRALAYEVALRFLQTHKASAFFQTSEWVWRLRVPAARELVATYDEAFATPYSYRGRFVTMDTILLFELRRLAAWFVRPTPSFRFDIPRVVQECLSPPTTRELRLSVDAEARRELRS
jgi:CRISPR/Cas system-associated endonuclease Cas1